MFIRRGGFFGQIIYAPKNIEADGKIYGKIHLSKNILIDEYRYKSEILVFGDKKIKSSFKCLIGESSVLRKIVDNKPQQQMAPMMVSTSSAEFSSISTGLAVELR